MFFDLNLHIKDVPLGYREKFKVDDSFVISYFNRNAQKVGFKLVIHELSIGNSYFMDETSYFIFSNECLRQLNIQMPSYESFFETELSSVQYGVLILPFIFQAHPFFYYKREQFNFLHYSRN